MLKIKIENYDVKQSQLCTQENSITVLCTLVKMHLQKTYIMHTGKIHVQIIMKGSIKIYSREHSIPECLNFVVQD